MNVEIATPLDTGIQKTFITYANDWFTYHVVTQDGLGNILSEDTRSMFVYNARQVALHFWGLSIEDYPRTYEAAFALYESSKASLTLLAEVETEDENIIKIDVKGIGDWTVAMFVESLYGGRQIAVSYCQWMSRDDMLIIRDANFDGWSDIMICTGITASAKRYEYHLWDQQLACFFKSESFTALEPNPVFDAQTKTIRCEYLDGMYTYITSAYSVERGVPVLLYRETEILP